MGEAIIIIIFLLILFNLDKIGAFFVSLFYISLIALAIYVLFKILSAICNYCEKKSVKKAAEAVAKAEEERKKAKQAEFEKELNNHTVKESFFEKNKGIFYHIVNFHFKTQSWVLKQDKYEDGTKRCVFVNEQYIYVYIGSGPDLFNSTSVKWPEEKYIDNLNRIQNYERICIDIRNELKLLIPETYFDISKKVVLAWFAEGIKNELKNAGMDFTYTSPLKTYSYTTNPEERYYYYFNFNTPAMQLKTLK